MTLFIDKIVDRNIKKLNIIKNGTINNSSPKVNDIIPNLNIQLKEHQKSLIYACIELEKTSHISQITSDNIHYQSNIGIIGDSVGSGKSISVLGLICIKPKLDDYIFPNEYTVHESWGIISYNCNIKSTNIHSNVILVPHSIINQWETYIMNYTKLSYIKINSTKSCGFTKEKIESSDIILISNNFFSNFIDCLILLYGNISLLFDRFIIDEADNIKFGVNSHIKSRFTWFITSSLDNLLFPTGRYFIPKSLKSYNHTISLTHYDLDYIQLKGLHYKNFIRSLFEKISTSSEDFILLMEYLCLKNADEYIAQSFELPKPNILLYKCLTPYSINFLSNITNSDTINKIRNDLITYINANDISSLKEKLGFKVESCENLSNMITFNLKKNLENENKHYAYIESLDIDDDIEKNERLQKISNKIKELESSITNVLERVNIEKNDTCPICFDKLTKPVCNVSCCHNLFCLSCITGYFNSKINKIGECPYCRTKIGFEGITIIEDNIDNINNDNNILLNKEKYLIKLISENNSKKWLVFSEFDATFNSLNELLLKNNIIFSKVCGSASHIDNTIRNFDNGLIQVLLLNAVHFGMGLNLEMATDVLIYHKLSYEIEKQVIGRAQRPGRNNTLNIHYLCHDNEFEYYNTRIF